MSGQPFQIPGLGQAKPNESLPENSFAIDLIVAQENAERDRKALEAIEATRKAIHGEQASG